MQIRQVAQQLGLNPQTLYFYERIGLIPEPTRSPAGYRLYGQADLERLHFIGNAKALGLSLEEIKELLVLQEGEQFSCQEVKQRLLKKMAQLDQKIHDLQALKAQLEPLLEQCDLGLTQSDPLQQCQVFKESPLTVINDRQD